MAHKLTPEPEHWEDALSLHKLLGKDAPILVGRHIGVLEAAMDFDGAARWRAIQSRLNMLRDESLPQ